MKTKLAIGGVILGIGGLMLPNWMLGSAGLVLLSVTLPWAGIVLGFRMDILFGAPVWLPAPVAYPFTIAAAVIGIGSLIVRQYIR